MVPGSVSRSSCSLLLGGLISRAEAAVAEGEDRRGAGGPRQPPALLLVHSAIPRCRGSPFICMLGLFDSAPKVCPDIS